MITNPKLTHHLNTMTTLMQHQPAGLQGIDLIFTTKSFAKKKMLKTSNFYTEAIQGITELDIKKKINNPREEKIFYNKTFCTNGRIIVPNETTRRHRVHSYGQLLDEVQKRANHQQYIRGIATLYDNITQKDLYNRQEHILITSNEGKIKFDNVTQKILYEEMMVKKYYASID